MKRTHIFAVIALVMVFALALTACGSKDAAETTESTTVQTQAPIALPGLADWSLTPETWSSPNGATVHMSAAPETYADGMSAVFAVRLEGEDVAALTCEWDGSHFTASADLNAADGYCYYLILTSGEEQTEIALNTPASPTDDSLINMATALVSYCNVVVASSDYTGGTLTITGGSVEVQAPRITNVGETITCSEVALVLTYNGEELDRANVTLSESELPSSYELDLTDVSFDVPTLEDDQQLSLRLDVTLSNGQFLTAPGCTWSYIDGQLVSIVG